MSEKVNNFPVFLSGKPHGQDKFEGKSQEKIANIIIDLIKEDKLEKKVIGLEGEWGSGKSNVIEMIKNNIGDKYYTFIFDAWGNQEDLTRRTFLEEIIDKLFENGFLVDKEKWQKKKEQLLAKKHITTKYFYPHIKPFWIFIMASILLFAFLSGVYSNVLVNYDILSFWQAKIWKPLISIYLLPTILFFIGAFLLVKEYILERENNGKKDKVDNEDKSQTISKIFYWLKGENIETEEKENIIEDEPTIKQFRNYFKLIQNDLKIEKKGLIIVFDNIDRLDKEKVKALWSSIHTFFAEHSYNNTWVIIPYYKEKLTICFDGQDVHDSGFIDKTFSINFRVSPPVVSDWDFLLKEKIKEAFGDDFISADETKHLIDLFDILTEGNTIKPRQIINYVNQLVVLYKQWKAEVDTNEIKFRYLALYVLTKDKILLNPVDNILDKGYLAGSASMFSRDEELDNIISALVFNVKKELADEVLLKRELTQALRSGKIESIEKSKGHNAFKKYFSDSYNTVDFATKRKSLCKVIDIVSDVFSPETISNYWEDFAENLDGLNNQFDNFNDDHRTILINISENSQKDLLKKLIKNSLSDLSTEENQKKYYSLIAEIDSFLNEKEFTIKIESFITEQNFHPTQFLSLIEKEKTDYQRFKIKCLEKEFLDYFYSEEDIDAELLQKHLKSIEIVKEKYNFKKWEKDIIQKLQIIAHTEYTVIHSYINLLKIVGKKPLSVKLSTTFYTQLSDNTIAESIFFDCIAIAISDFGVAIGNINFQNTINSLNEEYIEKISDVIEWYIVYGDILDLVVKYAAHPFVQNLKKIAYRLTYKSNEDSRLSISSVLKNFSIICEKVFDNDNDKIGVFISMLNGWSTNYDSNKFESVDEKIFNYLQLQELEIIKMITKDSVDFVAHLDKEVILESFKEENKTFIIIEALLNNSLLAIFDEHFYKAYEEYLNEIVNSEIEIPESDFFTSILPSKIDGRKLKGIYTRIRDKILNNPEEIGYEKINFFIDGLITHGNLDKEADKVTYKLVNYIFESGDAINSIFASNVDFFIDVILKSSEYIDGAKTTITVNIDVIKDDEVKNKLVEVLKLIIPKDKKIEP